jgi:hypothetical protein
MGQTITTDSKTGGIIVALLAVFTSLGMTHLWHLLTFFYHQSRAKGSPNDGLFLHQQALLRTLPTPSSLMADSMKLWLAWRRVSDHALTRSFAHLLIALLFAMGSLTVSIFSSSIVSSSNLEVLVQSPHCGMLDGSGNGSWESYLSSTAAAAKAYAPDCYQPGSLPAQCNAFLRPNIPFKAQVVQCPFEDKICASSAISLDSGLIDINDAFGLNLEEADRIKYRRKTVCTILSLDGYTRTRNATREDSTGRLLFNGEEVIEYLYGTIKSGGYMGQSTFTGNVSHDFLSTTTTNWQFKESYYSLIPELQRNDADV